MGGVGLEVIGFGVVAGVGAGVGLLTIVGALVMGVSDGTIVISAQFQNCSGFPVVLAPVGSKGSAHCAIPGLRNQPLSPSPRLSSK